MPRQIKCRRVTFLLGVVYFKPAGIPLTELEEILLTIDEIEAIRLKDIDDLEQGHFAAKMDISRLPFKGYLNRRGRK